MNSVRLLCITLIRERIAIKNAGRYSDLSPIFTSSRLTTQAMTSCEVVSVGLTAAGLYRNEHAKSYIVNDQMVHVFT